jgi:C1A family cysteine protease
MDQELQSTYEEHGMAVVDFDDNKRLFKVSDSHGPDKGDRGFIWLSYDPVLSRMTQPLSY